MKIIRIAYVLIVSGWLAGQAFGFDLVPFRDGDLWGYADPFGSIVYPPEYKSAGVFRNGIALVQTQDGYGYIAMNGRAFFASNLRSSKTIEMGKYAIMLP